MKEKNRNDTSHVLFIEREKVYFENVTSEGIYF